ncbi:MAG: dihydrodipicolinate synthase family protein [Acidobacteria bacterium]|nr:dihydrodipicolinate synthase family protein [Acidobacteriota bacterium]
MGPKGTEWKEWAKEHLVGLENTLMPSFTTDLRQLDEEGIRWDVQQIIHHGFTSAMCTVESGLTMEENKRFLEIATDEAKGKVHVSFIMLLDSFKKIQELLQHGEKVGVTHATVSYPQWYYPKSLNELYETTKGLCDAANLGIVLYATERFDFSRFHPSSVPFELFDKLVQIPNVIGMKVGFPEPAMVFEVFRRYSETIQVNVGASGMLGMYPALIQRYRVQWAGAGIWEVWQSPEKPYLVEYFNHVLKGRLDEAMKIYWFLARANALSALGGKQQIGGFDLGMNGWAQAKYISWSVGGNGGPVRQPSQALTWRQMEARKALLRRLEIMPREPEEEFFLGRVRYARLKAQPS